MARQKKPVHRVQMTEGNETSSILIRHGLPKSGYWEIIEN